MKIAWLHSHLQYWTGGTRFIFEVVRRMNKVVRTDLFVQTSARQIRGIFLGEEIRLKTIGASSTYSPFFWVFFPYYVHRDGGVLRNILKAYDVIITSMFPMNVIARAVGRRHFQYCFEPYAMFHDRRYADGFPTLRRVFILTMRLLYSKHDVRATQNALKVFTTVKEVNYWISRVYNRKAIPTYVGVDTDFFQRKVISPFKDRNNDNKIIICNTDYTALKRVDFIVSAMPAIIREVPNCELLISHTVENRAGIRRLRSIVKNLNLEHKVKLLGFVDVEDLPLFYSSADVAIYAGSDSAASCNSLFVLEAMACETPVVRTDITRDEVEHGETGFLFHENDKNQMVDFVVQILSNEKRSRVMGKAARERIKRMYQWDLVTRKILEGIRGT